MRGLAAWVALVCWVCLVTGSVAQLSRTTLDLRAGPQPNASEVSNLALLLALDFTSAGAAYRHRATGYDPGTTYLGYHHANACYGYHGTSDDGHFEPTGDTDAEHACNLPGTGRGFSGNFLNFVNTAWLDILRLGLTGGDRVVDEAPSDAAMPRTVLQRAVLPSDTTGARNTNFYDGDSGYDASARLWEKVVLPAGSPLTSRVTPFDNSKPVVVKACKDEIYFGDTDTGSCAAPGANANLAVASISSPSTTVTGRFKARVLVCSPTEGPRRPELCQKQASGQHKPVGVLQKQADRRRVAVFAYLNDAADWQTANEGSRHGGVLRAPMKFAGPQQTLVSGAVSVNPQSEWDPLTGVLATKPLDTARETGHPHSGVIHYINRLGRLAFGTDLYKRRQPVGELHHEAIRYFQGQSGPSADAVGGLTPSMLGGYPVYTDWTDPMQTGCQRNHAVLVGGANPSRDAALPGSRIGGQSRAADTWTVGGQSVTLNADTWTRVVSSFETNGTLSYVDAQGVTRAANGNASAGPTGVQSGSPYSALESNIFGDSAGYLHAGVAYWANTQAIRPDKPQARVRTWVLDADEGGNGSLVRSRALYLTGKYGGFADVGADGRFHSGEGNPFQSPLGGGLTTTNREWLAADASTAPIGYFLVGQPERLLMAIQKVFAAASQATGPAAGVAVSAQRLNATHSSGAVYRVFSNLAEASGTVVRTELRYNPDTQQTEASTWPTWDAGQILTGSHPHTTPLVPVPTAANRKIFTHSRSASAGVAFIWGQLDAAVQTALKTHPATGVIESDTLGQQRLSYLRGDRSQEASLFRPRTSVLGDMAAASLVLKGAPSPLVSDTSYAAFMAAHSARVPTLYVGANDGMLHAFRAADDASDATSGRELFAYVPRAVSGKLNQLTEPGYLRTAFVDGGLTVDEARVHRPSTGTVEWATVLAGGLGGGAQGLYALDVTEPDRFGAAHVMWEFTDADDPDMGNLVAAPRIVPLAVAGASGTEPVLRWFVMASSGYNNYASDSHTSDTGRQALFLLSLEKLPTEPWVLNGNYFKLIANDSAFTSATAAKGLAMPGIARGPKGNALAAYAGDLQGNLWKFDLSGPSSTWAGTAATSVLFVASDSSGGRQPITVAPLVRPHPQGSFQLVFGTGQWLEPRDAWATGAQSLYGVWDAADGQTVRRAATASVNGLVARRVTPAASAGLAATLSGADFHYGRSTAEARGWYADFPDNAERLTVDPSALGGVVALNSALPGGDPCAATGRFNTYRLNPLSGQSLATTVLTRAAGDGGLGHVGSAVGLMEGTATWSERDATGRYLVTDTVTTVSAGAQGLVLTRTPVSKLGGRMSWREISQFQ